MVPPVPGSPPPDPFLAVKRVRVTLDSATREVDGRTQAFITTPAVCPPARRWLAEASFAYRDGVTQTAASPPSACRRQDRGGRRGCACAGCRGAGAPGGLSPPGCSRSTTGGYAGSRSPWTGAGFAGAPEAAACASSGAAPAIRWAPVERDRCGPRGKPRQEGRSVHTLRPVTVLGGYFRPSCSSGWRKAQPTSPAARSSSRGSCPPSICCSAAVSSSGSWVTCSTRRPCVRPESH